MEDLATVDAAATRSQWYYDKRDDISKAAPVEDLATVDAAVTRSHWYYGKRDGAAGISGSDSKHGH